MTVSDLGGLSLSGCDLTDARLVDCDLRTQAFEAAIVDGTRFVRCVFSEHWLTRARPSVVGPYVAIDCRFELSNGPRAPLDAFALEVYFCRWDPIPDALRFRWPLPGRVEGSADVMHMSVLWGIRELEHRGASGGLAQLFDALVTDGPPALVVAPPAIVEQVRAAAAARLPRWRPPLP